MCIDQQLVKALNYGIEDPFAKAVVALKFFPCFVMGFLTV